MPLKLHHLNASRSQRIVWLLNELGVPHEIIHHKRDETTRLAPPDLLKIHPMGKSPLLEDDGIVIAETGAIAEYLIAKFDPDHRLHPRADSPDFPRYLEWLHAAEGAVFLPSLLTLYLGLAGAAADSPIQQRNAQELEKAANYIEAHLTQHPYFAGENFSAADCLMGFQIMSGAARGGLTGRPATAAWVQKVTARPAFKAMLAVGV
ncbi:glutathione S-transferase family protein [Hyphomonas sp.]|uniref:glutathione S-transferase family protein n=1 Tax=Hyphomonas sp. TaxID=87 RepID=UPI00391A0C9B